VLRGSPCLQGASISPKTRTLLSREPSKRPARSPTRWNQSYGEHTVHMQLATSCWESSCCMQEDRMGADR
jgi:hypothetical protein